MKWIQEHKKLSVFLIIVVLLLIRRIRWYSVNDWSFLLGFAGWIIPILQMHWRNKNKKGMGRFAPVLSMGACCLSIWMQLYHYLENIEDLPRLDIITAHGVWIVALFLLVTTVLLNLILAGSEKYIDRKNEEDYDLTI